MFNPCLLQLLLLCFNEYYFKFGSLKIIFDILTFFFNRKVLFYLLVMFYYLYIIYFINRLCFYYLFYYIFNCFDFNLKFIIDRSINEMF